MLIQPSVHGGSQIGAPVSPTTKQVVLSELVGFTYRGRVQTLSQACLAALPTWTLKCHACVSGAMCIQRTRPCLRPRCVGMADPRIPASSLG